MATLPPAHRDSLKMLLELLADVAENVGSASTTHTGDLPILSSSTAINKMSPQNLAIVFGPNLFQYVRSWLL